MSNSIKIRGAAKNGVATIKVLIRHSMETGRSKDARTGQLIPAHFIKEVICKHQGKQVLEANWGAAVSKNPYLSFSIANAQAGEKISISWLDNQGKSDSKEVTLS